MENTKLAFVVLSASCGHYTQIRFTTLQSLFKDVYNSISGFGLTEYDEYFRLYVEDIGELSYSTTMAEECYDLKTLDENDFISQTITGRYPLLSIASARFPNGEIYQFKMSRLSDAMVNLYNAFELFPITNRLDDVIIAMSDNQEYKMPIDTIRRYIEKNGNRMYEKLEEFDLDVNQHLMPESKEKNSIFAK